ncbi:MAG: zf-HC2 domain-containing protein, partial [Lachnospiraceae bacterium]|nr:zf-HC2 domain-containing protein [Lachnospiraceae bacterium]
MKCEIANDLLTLYVEDLCSPEARKEVEAHLGECPECSKKLEHYRKELKDEVSNIGEADSEKKDTV